jgi:gamma-glutamylcyclotransferase (GGCT)/AIG2-like uncharacterized protein YtfP
MEYSRRFLPDTGCKIPDTRYWILDGEKKYLKKFWLNINNKIFVYGTLMDGLFKKGIPGIDLHIKKRENGKINARLFDLGKYPGAKRTTIKSKEVFGKIYEVDLAHFINVLITLDDYEEFDPRKKEASLYIRKITPVITANGILSRAWVYWYNKPVNGKHEIDTGDYKKYLKRNKF